MEDFHWKYDDLEFGWDENGHFYKILKEKYKESYMKAVKEKENCQFSMSIWQKAAKMAQSTLFCGPVMTFFSKFLFLSSLLIVTLYILLLFSHAVFGI